MKQILVLGALGASTFVGELCAAPDKMPPSPKVVRVEINMNGNFEFLARATELARKAETREFGLQTLSEVSGGIAELFYLDEFYDQRDTPRQNRKILNVLADYFEESIRSGIAKKIYTKDTLDALSRGFMQVKARIRTESQLPESERIRKPSEVKWRPALSFGAGMVLVGDISRRIAKRLGLRAQLMWQNRKTGEMWKRTREEIRRPKGVRKSEHDRVKKEACKTWISTLGYDLRAASRWLGARALMSGAVGLVSYATYFEDNENYDASDDIVENRILPFLNQMKKEVP